MVSRGSPGWQVFLDRFLLGRYILGSLLPVFEYCSAVWCSAADTHIKLPNRVVSGACFLTGSVFECDIPHCRSVAVPCKLYKIRGNPIHPLYGSLSVPYVPVRVTSDAMVAHRYTYAHVRCKTPQYPRTHISLSVSLWNDLADAVFDGLGLVGFMSWANAFSLA